MSAPLQPYQCSVCLTRFTRHENLKRHAAAHARAANEGSLPCSLCAATFSRPDLRNRHMRRKHAARQPPASAARRRHQPRLPPSLSPESSPPAPTSPESPLPDVRHCGSASAPDTWRPSAAQTREGCRLFFRHVAYFLPFLHRPTFDASRTPHHLLLAMLALGYQYGEDPDHGNGGSANLSLRCFRQAHSLLLAADCDCPAREASLSTVQAYLLMQVYSVMYLCDESVDMLAIHAKLISRARAGGLMQPAGRKTTQASEDDNGDDLEALWRQSMAQEACKRTLFAVHQMDALLYQLLSIPRSVSHLELKHDLPCPQDVWNAPSAAAWAHRQLVDSRRKKGSQLPYTDAVRLFLTPDADVAPLTASFDPYGAVSIVQFLISSAREISGWSTMTGMLSIERIRPLKASLVTLSPFIHGQESGTDHDDHPHDDDLLHVSAALMCEATWEMAMIELQLWSPAHTGGIVGKTLAAALAQSVHVAPVFLYEPDTARALQPHLDWFLQYLEAAQAPDREAPWLALYAYKSFQIAWQLLCRGFPGAMQAVGVDNGNRSGGLAWARRVFRRRARWKIGRLIIQCLDELETNTMD